MESGVSPVDVTVALAGGGRTETGSGDEPMAADTADECAMPASFFDGIVPDRANFVLVLPLFALGCVAELLRDSVAADFGRTAGTTSLVAAVRFFFRALNFLRASLAVRFASLNALRAFFSATFAVFAS